MKKIVSIVLMVVLTVALFAGCSKETASGDVIKIGINYELSGDNATYGQGSVEGIELAIEQINSQGGVNGKKN